MGSDDSPSALLAAIDWLVSLAQGSIATSIAIIAVAALGLMMLTGRLKLKQAARVIFGCFVLFGASVILGFQARHHK